MSGKEYGLHFSLGHIKLVRMNEKDGKLGNRLLFPFKKLALLFGFPKNSRYVKDYLNEANLRSGAFMCVVIFGFEIWMIIRGIHKIFFEQTGNTFLNFFQYTSNFWIYLFMGLSFFSFCMSVLSHKASLKKRVAWAMGLNTPLLLFIPLLTFERFSSDPVKVALMVIFYSSGAFLALCVYASEFVLLRKGKLSSPWIILVIVAFAVACMAFGIKVSYSDFLSSSEPKQIICFLTVAFVVGCLLIWKPYVSLLMLGGIFTVFLLLLQSVADKRAFYDGDMVNYWIFFAFLSIVTFSIYHQRVSEASKAEGMQILATVDRVSGLHSFAYFIDLVQKEVDGNDFKEGERYYLFIDVTGFKLVNDQRGFEEGNLFLKKVGQAIQEAFPGELVTRQADDHFLVFASPEGLEGKIDSLNRKVHDLDPEIGPGVHVGGYPFRRKEENQQRPFDRARFACSTLKGFGGRIYRQYDLDMHEGFKRMQYVIHTVDKAAAEGWIRPYYQPVVYAKDGKLCGYEALVRWIDPVKGFMSPASFVPILEDTRLIHKLDEAIIRAVCKDLRRLLDEGKPALPVSINFSRLDFELMDAVAVLEKAVSDYKVPKNLLHVEITESALVDDEGLLREAMDKLHELGYALWLDDFGSGYSFNVLKDFHFDVLKIDMKFLGGFEENPKAGAIVKAIISMADSIGMKTLAEGVETAEEAAFLAKSGCGRLQGYHYGKAIPLDEALKAIESGKLIPSDRVE